MIGKYCFLNGKFLNFKNAGLPLNDLGILRNYGVFDFLRTYNKKPFLLREHLGRFRQSARLLNLPLRYSDAYITRAISALISLNNFPETSVRLVLTGGPTEDGIHYIKPTFFILAEKSESLPNHFYEKGIATVTHEYKREVPQAKTTQYREAIYLRNQKRYRNYPDIVYISNGFILEGTTSNFFLIKGNTIITPKRNVLIGTTRNCVIRLAKERFIKVEERDIFVSELQKADEAFFTATNKEILPIVQIDGKSIGNRKVGRHTKELQKRFRAYTIKN